MSDPGPGPGAVGGPDGNPGGADIASADIDAPFAGFETTDSPDRID